MLAKVAATKATKDCRVCNRRRIKCDRTLPTCSKCDTRGLDCPGYGLRLKWDQGVASRGRLRGLQEPITPPSTRSPRQNCTAVGDERGHREIDSGHQHACDTNERVLAPMDDADSMTENLFTTFAFYAPEGLSDPMSRRLLHHYIQFVAPQMAWIDCTDNPFRNVILPLSLHSPSLLSSVLAIAAGDLSSRQQSDTPVAKGSRLALRSCQDKALGLLALHVRSERENSTNVAQVQYQTHMNSILATILILCSLEIKQAPSNVWRIHLRAAWTMMRHWMNSVSFTTDAVTTFLAQELYVMNVGASMTVFDDAESMTNYVLPRSENAIFMEFMRVIQHITETERNLNPSVTNSSSSTTDSRLLRTEIEYARDYALRCSRSLDFHSQLALTGLDHLINIFYEATLVYSQQALSPCSMTEHFNNTSRDQLFEHLRQLVNLDSFAQDLVWPVFIAGTESRGRPEDQLFVKRIMHEIIRLSGMVDRPRVIEFLDDFWSMPYHGSNLNWISVARQWAHEGKTFLVM